MKTMIMFLSLCFAASAMPGCAHNQAAKLPAETAAGSTGSGGTKTSPERVAAGCTLDGDCAAGKLCVNQTCADAKIQLDACTAVRVHFALDSTEIAEQDRVLLELAAGCLRASRTTKVTIEGNADERGTDEYNVALGDRRAQAVARYLEKLGATPDQVKTVSYGKENPLCSEHDEACWAKNRRAGVQPSK